MINSFMFSGYLNMFLPRAKLLCVSKGTFCCFFELSPKRLELLPLTSIHPEPSGVPVSHPDIGTANRNACLCKLVVDTEFTSERTPRRINLFHSRLCGY